jgi:hypothetical protein
VAPFVLPGLAVLSAFILQATALPVPLVGHGWAQLDPEYWPTTLRPQLQAYVEECQSAQPPREPCIFSEMLFGGYLIRYVPGSRIYIDDRCELYGDDFLRDFCVARGNDPARPEGNPEWVGRQVDAYGIDLALVGPDSPFSRYFDRETARSQAALPEIGASLTALSGQPFGAWTTSTALMGETCGWVRVAQTTSAILYRRLRSLPADGLHKMRVDPRSS